VSKLTSLGASRGFAFFRIDLSVLHRTDQLSINTATGPSGAAYSPSKPRSI